MMIDEHAVLFKTLKQDVCCCSAAGHSLCIKQVLGVWGSVARRLVQGQAQRPQLLQLAHQPCTGLAAVQRQPQALQLLKLLQHLQEPAQLDLRERPQQQRQQDETAGSMLSNQRPSGVWRITGHLQHGQSCCAHSAPTGTAERCMHAACDAPVLQLRSTHVFAAVPGDVLFLVFDAAGLLLMDAAGVSYWAYLPVAALAFARYNGHSLQGRPSCCCQRPA